MGKACVVILGGCLNVTDNFKDRLSSERYHILSIDECSATSRKKKWDESFVLSRETIQPAGGYKSYSNAKMLFENSREPVVSRLSEFTSITIIALSTCIVGYLIDELIQGIAQEKVINVHLITPFSFENSNKLKLSEDVIRKVHTSQEKFSHLTLTIVDGKDFFGLGNRNSSLLELFESLSSDLLKNILLQNETIDYREQD